MHAMIDLETLSLAANAVVTEIGLVTFDIHTQDLILDQHSWHLDILDQMAVGRGLNIDTLIWWLKQNEEARLRFANASRQNVYEVLQALHNAIDWSNIEGVWSHGLNFDIPILESLHQSYGKKTPWHYRTPRDTRTLFWLAGGLKPEGHVVAHSAVDDCIAQAKCVQKAMGILRDATPGWLQCTLGTAGKF